MSKKPDVYREATARGVITLKAETTRLIKEGKIKKGNVVSVAQMAGVLAAKKTSELIPLCHPLPLSDVQVTVEVIDATSVAAQATVKTIAKTGVEMEALAAVSTALLTVWDMTKQYEKNRHGQYPTTLIRELRVVRKVKAT